MLKKEVNYKTIKERKRSERERSQRCGILGTCFFTSFVLDLRDVSTQQGRAQRQNISET